MEKVMEFINTDRIRRKDLTGSVHGCMKVIEYLGVRKNYSSRHTHWLCRCECGKEIIKTSNDIKRTKGKYCSLDCDLYPKFLEELSHKRVGKERGPYRNSNPKGAHREVMRAYKTGARNRGHEWSLTEAEFFRLTTANCIYCNLPPNREIGGRYSKKLIGGIDRIDNSKGYHIDNCAPCCKECNFAKGSMGIETWNNWINRIVQNNI